MHLCAQVLHRLTQCRHWLQQMNVLKWFRPKHLAHGIVQHNVTSILTVWASTPSTTVRRSSVESVPWPVQQLFPQLPQTCSSLIAPADFQRGSANQHDLSIVSAVTAVFTDSKTLVGLQQPTKLSTLANSGEHASDIALNSKLEMDRVVGHPRPSLSGIGVPWVSLPGPTDVPYYMPMVASLDAQGGIKAKRQPFRCCGVWPRRCLLCSLPHMFNVILLHRLLYMFRVSQQRLLECDNTNPCSMKNAVLRTQRRSNSFGCLFVLCVLRPTNLDNHAQNLVRNLIARFLLAACSTPMQIRFTLMRLLCIACLELLRCLLHLRSCRVDACGEIRFDAVHVPCVDFLLQCQPLGNCSCCHRIG